MKKRALKQLQIKKVKISELSVKKGGVGPHSGHPYYCHSDLCKTQINCQIN